MVVGVFAGIPVGDYDRALEWYKRLLGAEPAFYPNDIWKYVVPRRRQRDRDRRRGLVARMITGR